MPIMRLKSDFVAEIQAKLQPESQVIERVVEKIIEVEVAIPTPASVATSVSNLSVPTVQSASNESNFVNNEHREPENLVTTEINPNINLNESQVLVNTQIQPVSVTQLATSLIVNHSDQRLALLYSHFELMQEFLASQGRSASFFGQAGEIITNFHGQRLLPETFLREQSAPVNKFPLLGKISSQNQTNLVCESHFNLEKNIFLYDHTLGGELSQRYSELIPLPVIPFTISMEILAEAALYLTGATNYVIGVYDLRGYRWLALDQGELILNIEAQLLPQTDAQFFMVKVQLFQANNQEGLNRHLVFEGMVKLAAEFTPPPAPMPFQLNEPAHSQWTDEQLYQTGMFHGPRFQGVKHIRAWDKQGIEADLAVIAIDDFFANQSYQPLFQIDSGLLDAAGQLVGYWVSEQFGTDFNVFPFNVESFEQYEPPLLASSYILCRGLMKFVSERQTRSSFDFLNQDGRVIARLEGWQDRYFSVPHRYYQCRLHPQTSYLSEPYLQAETGIICRRIEPLPEGFLDDSWSIWKRVLAHLMLNQAERDFWYNLPEKGNRRTDWLLGRIATKDAIRQWCDQNYQLAFAPVDIEIFPNSEGKPIVKCPELEQRGILPQVSISHSHGYVIAAVVPPNTQIGIDLQRFSDDSLKIAFAPQELALLPNQNPESLTILWAAKKAVSKAYGTGLQGNPKKWCITNYVPSQQRVTVAYNNQCFNCQILNLTTEIVAICQYSTLGETQNSDKV
jgi:phosphopantetheinyl transferase